MKKLAEIQQKLKAPKSQFNAFGKYKYRSCEDIVEAVKPLLDDHALVVVDNMVEVGGRIYVKATAQLINPEGQIIQASAYAREPDSRKGMDPAQVTGATSSYARKYALNGLFAIDDTKDPDSTNAGDTTKLKDGILRDINAASGDVKNEMVDALGMNGCRTPGDLAKMSDDTLVKIRKAFDEILG